MKSKTICLLRHGQTDLNKNGIVQGRGLDTSLNETGKAQAEKVYQTLKDVHFDYIFTSGLVRTRETVDHFLRDGIPFKSLEGFDEISWGDQEGRAISKEFEDCYLETIHGWRNGNMTLHVGGGETPLQVMQRQREAMAEVMGLDKRNILICMHGRAMRILLCWLLNYPLRYMDGFPHQNCSYYVLGYRVDSFFLKVFNEVDYLN